VDEGWALGLGWLLFALMLAALAIEVGPLRVTPLLYDHRRLGAELGYPTEREEGAAAHRVGVPGLAKA